MTEPNQSSDLPSGDLDSSDSTADYDPDQDQDTEPSTMAPTGEGPTDPQD
jgi:hypothetical protein